mmetsp:Transcript_17845/g.46606  ORF Transcript_17845/g.46606 Transcript_17845/m.46606 type:complete len:204 (-) Transcript_17845:642-1253(-)
MSSPRAATSVATKTVTFPARKSASALSRCDCDRSPWIAAVRTPSNSFMTCRDTHCATCFFCVKTITLSDARSGALSARILQSTWSLSRLSLRSTLTSSCVMESVVDPTRPTVTKTYSRMYFLAMRCIGSGNVAENISVFRESASGRSNWSQIRRICGSNPISSIRSASSSTRKRTFASEMMSRPRKSVSRPGVATKMSTPWAS